MYGLLMGCVWGVYGVCMWCVGVDDAGGRMRRDEKQDGEGVWGWGGGMRDGG